MHKAYELHPPSKISVQIESIAGYGGNNVILGTRQGHLLQYSFQPSSDGKMELQLLQYDKNFSKKPILQLQVLEDYNLLFSLSDNQISINDISRHNFPLIHLAAKTKGANAFTMDIKRFQTLTGNYNFYCPIILMSHPNLSRSNFPDGSSVCGC